MKLYCAYDKSSEPEKADHKCDFCGKLLCRICGYSKDGIDYCNECWTIERTNSHKSAILEDKLKNRGQLGITN